MQALARKPTRVSDHQAMLTRALIVSALLVTTLPGCGSATAPATWHPGNAQPLTAGWQQYFSILWGATRQDGGALIEGYITNTWGFAVRDVRVLVVGYDASGAQTGQVIAWGPNAIQPGDRVYFDVRVPAAAATYDVSVFSWEWTWPPSGGTSRHEEEAPVARASSCDERSAEAVTGSDVERAGLRLASAHPSTQAR